jgi:multicomponent Na+:H+ antiporter subunit B
MSSCILCTATRFLLPLLLLFSLFLVHRGHNEPGGGFVGGLVAAAGFALYTIAFTVRDARLALRASPQTLIAAGLFLAAGAGLSGLLAGEQFLSGLWLPWEIPAVGKIGTPLIFDVGVYLLVVGVTLAVVFSLAEQEE